LHGYKTFAAKTTFRFAEGITAIVGPNGSGKSNIADALRWVLGEQSYSLLRAKKTEDMIFAGSEQRPRAGMASAGVTFDNSNGWLPVDFSEVSLARRAYRDGRNEYLLNSQHVRLKDINELLAQSGLSERTYTILGQGLVDASLALKADERRRLFEEAAGIGLYRSRREEALRRLDATQRNLDRVLDILAELEPRLKSLERQAARAQEYAQVQADLKLLLREWYGYHWHRAQHELADSLELSRSQEVKLLEARETYQGLRQNYASFRDRLNALRARLNSWHRQSAQLHENRESVSQELATQEERQRSLLDSRQATESEAALLVEELKSGRGQHSEAEKEFLQQQGELAEASSQLTSARAELETLVAEKQDAERELNAERKKLEALTTTQIQLGTRLEELGSRQEAAGEKRVALEGEFSAADAALEKAEDELEQAANGLKASETAVKKVEAEQTVVKRNQLAVSEELKQKNAELTQKLAEQDRLRARLEILDQAEQALEGYGDGARLLLDAARKKGLRGVRDIVSRIMDVPADLETAITAALGEYLDAVILLSGQDAGEALKILDDDRSGRASLLPLDWLKYAQPLKIVKSGNCLGVAADLVQVTPEYRPVVDLLLGHVLVVKDRQAARPALSGQPDHARAVTLHGEVYFASGQVLAGQTSKTASLGRPRQRRELQKALETTETAIQDLHKSIAKTNRRLTDIQSELEEIESKLAEARAAVEAALRTERSARGSEESARRQRDWLTGQREELVAQSAQVEAEQASIAVRIAQIDQEVSALQEAVRTRTAALAGISMDEVQQQVAAWTTRSAVAENALGAARRRLDERQAEIGRVETRALQLSQKSAEIEQALTSLDQERETLRSRTSSMNRELEDLRGLIQPAEQELASTETMEAELQKMELDGQGSLSRVERQFNQIQLDLGRRQEALENLRQKIEDDFGLVAFDYATDVSGPVPLPFEGMVEQLPSVPELPADLEENLNRQRALIRRMGAVNPEAQQEFKSVKERHVFLTTQLEDLRKAEADLHQVIAELDELTRREFQKTFQAVADEFHVIFHRLFGGGSARLVLTDPENLTETGIDIEARLPGRREQGLSLLSGGERSLTAIALVFSLLRVSPTPVCVMDEVDAMLDEANVGRFRDLLVELSKQTQFIIITHNRNTVQAADVIYGVTMGRDSASQIISLKLDEISEEYLK
jgi:chromosome segregation protein